MDLICMKAGRRQAPVGIHPWLGLFQVGHVPEWQVAFL